MSAARCACGHLIPTHNAIGRDQGGTFSVSVACRFAGCPCPGFHRGTPTQGPHEPVSSLAPTCPTHPGVPLVTFCPACRGAQGGKARTPKKAEASRVSLAKARTMRQGPTP